ncbi:hypothetical protein D9M68_670800 [compost metagenome]
MEQVINDLGLRAMHPYFEIVGGIHVHHRGAQSGTALRAKQLKERPDFLTRAPAPNPEHPLARRLDDDRGIAMALLDSKLVHRYHRDAT